MLLWYRTLSKDRTSPEFGAWLILLGLHPVPRPASHEGPLVKMYMVRSE